MEHAQCVRIILDQKTTGKLVEVTIVVNCKSYYKMGLVGTALNIKEQVQMVKYVGLIHA